MPSLSRRDFLKTSASLAAVAAPAVNVLGANEKLNVGCIGTGGRCRFLMKSLAGVPNVRIGGLADIYDGSIDAAKPLADKDAFITKNYKELLARKDIDAVLIGAPDHWHVPMTIDACAAGKDVYVEKPLTHNLEEGQAVIDTQNKHKRIVQVGTQQRSMPHFQKGLELLKAGRLGTIHKVSLSWNRNTDRVKRGPRGIDPKKVDWKAFLGNAPDQPFDEYRLLGNWRWFWDFGGGIFTDLMVHFIDVAHWYLGLDHPLTAQSIGGFVNAKGIWETPDMVQTILTYPNDMQVYFEGCFCNARNAARIEFMGSDGTLYLDRGAMILYPERGKGAKEELILGTNPNRGADFYDRPDGELLHLTNWVECIKSRKTPTCPAEAGVSAAGAAHLANRALRAGQIAAWKS